ncbi:MAG: HAD family acid phosphatase [Bdellovibrionales bacterium]
MSQKALQKVLETLQKGGSDVACIFDLDSTLFCTKYRTQAIIEAYIKACSFDQDPSLKKQLQNIEVTKRDWSIRDILKRYNLDQNHEVLNQLETFWRKKFFTNDYLHYDKPYKGAVEFVNKLHELGATLFYLTARKEMFMLQGTLKTLKKYNFPLKTDKHLLLKVDREQLDAEYKKEKLQKISQSYKTLLFFENEPVILNLIAKSLKEIELYWMDSTHSGKETPPEKAIPISMDYC